MLFVSLFVVSSLVSFLGGNVLTNPLRFLCLAAKVHVPLCSPLLPSLSLFFFFRKNKLTAAVPLGISHAFVQPCKHACGDKEEKKVKEKQKKKEEEANRVELMLTGT